MRKITLIGLTLAMIAAVYLSVPKYARAASLTKGYVSFTFDDGDKTLNSNVLPIFSKYSLPGTSYIVTDYVGDGGHVTWDQIATLQSKYGWEIGNHTKSHKSLIGLTDQEAMAEMQGAQTAFLAHNIKNVQAFAPPFGDFDARTLSLIKLTGFLTSSRQAWTESDAFNTPANFNPWEINVAGMRSDVTVSQAKALIDAAVKDKKWLVLVLHQIVSKTSDIYQYKTANLDSIANYASTLKKSGKLDVVTVSQGYSLIKSIPAPTPVPIPTPVPTPTVDNLIKNPGFDSGLANWHSSGSGISAIDVTQATANQFSPYPGKRLQIVGGSADNIAYTDEITLPSTGTAFIFREWANIALTKGRFGTWVDEFDSAGNYISGKELGGFTASSAGSALTEFKYTRSSSKVVSIAINIYSEAGTSGTGLFDSCYFGL
jgi:peptidoglycan/xylan/chitin deacetylase (PgdA/CDA1 family)